MKLTKQQKKSREFRRSSKDVRKSPDLGIKSSHHRISVASRCVASRLQNLYAGSGKEKIIDAVFEHFQYDLEEAWLSVFQRRLLKGKFKWKRWKVMEKKLCEVFTRPFSQMGGFVVVHWVHPFRQVNARWWPEGQSESTKQLHVLGHSEAIFHMESQCHVLLLETV